MNVLSLFKTHYSVGKSILTLNPQEFYPDGAWKGLDEMYPVSVFDIAKKHDLKQVTVVDDSVSGFLEAHQNAKKAKVKLVYGIRFRVVNDIDHKDENTLKSLSKVIVLIKNTDGYKDLIRLTSCASKKGFYYKPNLDWKHLELLWSKNLTLVIPFYDSFIFQNVLHAHNCVPSISWTKETYLIENSGLPFDGLVQRKVTSWAQSVDAPILPARSIYYYKRDDFPAYLTFRCISERSLLEKPELEHCSSDSFSFQAWQEQDADASSVKI